MSAPSSDHNGDELPCEHTQEGDKKPCASSSTSRDDALEVQAAYTEYKKKLGQKRGTGKNAKASKRQKKDPLPEECSTFGVQKPCRVVKLPCTYPGCEGKVCFKGDHDESILGFVRSSDYEGEGEYLQDCQLEPENPAKGNCRSLMCASHTFFVIDRFVCDLCIDRGNAISDEHWD
jgi:hypothetical protein